MKWNTLSEFKYWPQLTAVILILIGFYTYRHFAYFNTQSGDAFVSAQIFNIESPVSGFISEVFVKDNQSVKKGAALLQVDPRPYRNAVNIAKQKYQDPRSNELEKLAAKSELDQANYLLEQTTIKAPEDGYVTNFNQAVGQYVAPGKPLFALVDNRHWWVVSRYKETTLRLIKPGDKADIELNMYPGKIFHGHVESIAWGINRIQAGNVISSGLMYSEATEDWISIAQRFPVYITIDDAMDEYPLRVGASAHTITYR